MEGGEREGFLEEVSFELGLKGWIGTCQVGEKEKNKTERQGILSTGNGICKDTESCLAFGDSDLHGRCGGEGLGRKGHWGVHGGVF